MGLLTPSNTTMGEEFRGLLPDVNGVFISCTNFRTLKVLDRLEADLGKPVVSSNQATLWAVLRMLRIGLRISGYGILLESS